jgi:lambda family phage holin
MSRQVWSMKMDNDWLLAITTFIAVHIQQLYAFGLAMAIAVFRVIYRKGSIWLMFIEGSLCGLITLAAIPLIAYFGLPDNMAQFAGGLIGWIGVAKLSEFIDRHIDKVMGKGARHE